MHEFTYKIYEGFPSEEALKLLAAINQEIFGFGETAEHLSSLFKNRQKILICFAFDAEHVIGFKVGFQEKSQYFESWRGGVLPQYRGKCIASVLLRRQHEWCATQKFKFIITTTNNQNIPMLIVNLRGGFEIVGTFLNHRKIMKVMLQKILAPLND